MTKGLKFETPGMGISQAADWFNINGKRYWISFMCDSAGRGKRRTWHVTATHYADKPIRVTVSKIDCFRYQAADLAIAEFAAFLP